ncbi:ATP-binding protein [Candidatus Latescibacterota bacterium]
MKRNRHRRFGSCIGKQMSGGVNKSIISSSIAGKRYKVSQSSQQQVQSFPLHDIIDRFLNTVSHVVGELRQPIQTEKESTKFIKVPLSYPLLDPALCTGCGICAEICPNHAIYMNKIAIIDESLCSGCKACLTECPWGAITFVEAG